MIVQFLWGVHAGRSGTDTRLGAVLEEAVVRMGGCSGRRARHDKKRR